MLRPMRYARSGTEPPSPTKPDSETAALYTQIKGMIAGRTAPPGQCQRPGCVLGDLDLVSRGVYGIPVACDQRPCPRSYGRSGRPQ